MTVLDTKPLLNVCLVIDLFCMCLKLNHVTYLAENVILPQRGFDPRCDPTICKQEQLSVKPVQSQPMYFRPQTWGYKSKVPVPNIPHGLDVMRRDRLQIQNAECTNKMPSSEFIWKNWVIFNCFPKPQVVCNQANSITRITREQSKA